MTDWGDKYLWNSALSIVREPVILNRVSCGEYVKFLFPQTEAAKNTVQDVFSNVLTRNFS